MTSTSRRSPTLRRRRLSRDLRRLRAGAGMTAAEVTKRCGWATGTLTKWERGDWQRPSLSNIRTLIELYGVTDETERATLEMLATQGRESSGWWHEHRQEISPGYSTYIGLEFGAEELTTFDPLVINGLLQTSAYARAVIESGPDELDEQQVDLLLAIRARRQELLTHETDPLRLWVVLDEAALQRQVGGPEVMREQCAHLLDMAKLARVTLQVAPFSAGAHPGVNGPFTIMTFPEAEDTPAVYLDSAVGQLLIEEEEEVKRFQIALQRLQAMALPPAESMRMIANMAA